MNTESTNNQADANNMLGNYHDKVPNYLNLACCVNGYSNLTTYDSKIRQDINKSREVSPIRPSTSSLHYCKQSNLLTPPTLLSMNDVDNQKVDQQQTNMKNNNNNNNNNNHHQHFYASEELKNGKEKRQLSFSIQQRVERLYGSQAMSQVFYSPNKGRKSMDIKPLKDTHNGSHNLSLDETDRTSDDLPVFRHLNAEFLSQLPKLSPKRQIINNLNNINNNNGASKNNGQMVDDYTTITKTTNKIIDKEINGTLNGAKIEQTKSTTTATTKDGHYFLKVLKSEQERLLHLADNAEQLIENLKQKPDTSEDTLGVLRSASGKARLLATKKMKQFEGLCMDNINPPCGDKFTTTNDDLQGFWDMVLLQVHNVDAMFEEIEKLKQNNWQKPARVEVKSTPNARQVKTPGKSLNKANDSKSNTPMSASALKREEQRKQLMEMKRKNKLAMAANKSAQEADEEATTLVNNPEST